MATVKFILVLLEVILLFNLLIAVHEWGHFLAAKWRGLKIDRFAIWFGKPLWKKKIDGVEYALGWIPAGGYVALPQMATMETIEGKSESSDKPLPPISPLDKTIVAFAGPLFSFLLAGAFAVVVWAVGRPISVAGDSTQIGWVQKTDPEGNPGPAWQAGLRPGDIIVAVDGHPVSHYSSASGDSIRWRIISSEGTNIALTYVRGGETNTVYARPYKEKTKWYKRKGLRQILVDTSFPAVVNQVFTNSPAAEAGLQPGDEIVKVNGENIYSYWAIVDLEQAMTNGAIQPIGMTIRRGTREFESTITAVRPLKPERAGPSLGIEWYINTNFNLIHPTPAEQIDEAAGMIFNTLGVLLSPKSDVGVQQLGGPVMIARVYKNLFEDKQGWRRVLWFSVIINVNLALLNLLPFPVLDGGHITLAIVEAIRRRPVSARLLQYLQTGCALVLIAFMLFIAFYDTGDWLRSARQDREAVQPIVFAPKQ